MENSTVQLIASLLVADRRWIALELVAEVGVFHKTVLHILHDIQGYHILAARWIPHEISEVQQWHRYAVTRDLMDQYQRKVMIFLDELSLWAEPGLANMNQTKNTNQMNGNIPVLLIQKKCTLHNVLRR